VAEIEVFYLPPYSPEYNPDEYLNGDLKRSVHSGSQPRTKDDLKHITRSFMKRLQFDPHHVQRYFRVKYVCYAA
jgi:transposase